MMQLLAILEKLKQDIPSFKSSKDTCKIMTMLKSSLSKVLKRIMDRSFLKQCLHIKILKNQSKRLNTRNLESDVLAIQKLGLNA